MFGDSNIRIETELPVIPRSHPSLGGNPTETNHRGFSRRVSAL